MLPWLPRGAFPEAGEERVGPPEQAVLRLGKSHLTSMVTPDIHGCVHLDLVTGPPETTDDDEIQCLGKRLLDSLESSLGIILTRLLEMRLEPKILAVLPVGPHPWCPADVFSPSRSRPGPRELEGLELAFFASR